jgi:hypothetical protein
MRVIPVGDTDSREWSTEREEEAREDVKNGKINAYYIFNVRRTFSCCGQTKFSDQPDYDSSLDLNYRCSDSLREDWFRGVLQVGRNLYGAVCPSITKRTEVTLRTTGQTLKPLRVLLMLTGCAGPTDRLEALYDYRKSIAAAAVKQPHYARPLQLIDASKSAGRVANIQPYPTIDTNRFTWVTSSGALRELCRGKPDPLLALQQALGLPPEQREDMQVFTFEVRPADMFRLAPAAPTSPQRSAL